MSRIGNISRKNKMVYQRTKEEREPARYPWLPYIFISIILTGLIYLLFFSGVFNIKSKEVVGYSNPSLIEEIIDSNLGNGLLKKNIIIFDSSEVSEAVKGDSGVISVHIDKIFPDKIKVIVEESTGALNWNTRGDNFVVDGRGYVIEKDINVNLPHLYDNMNIETDLGERVASPTFINYIITLNENFKPITGQEIDRIILFNTLSDIHVKSISGWTVYLDSTKEPVSQLENLAKVLREAKREGYSKIKYIDMRLDNRVYYK